MCSLSTLSASKCSFFGFGNVWSSTLINYVLKPENELASVHKGAPLVTLSVLPHLIGVSMAKEKAEASRQALRLAFLFPSHSEIPLHYF